MKYYRADLLRVGKDHIGPIAHYGRRQQGGSGEAAKRTSGLPKSLRACPRFAPSESRTCSVWPHRRLAMFGAIRWLAQLITVTDAATDITDLGDEAHLCNRRFVGTRPWPHLVNLSDFT